jgi:hypothetical protein
LTNKHLVINTLGLEYLSFKFAQLLMIIDFKEIPEANKADGNQDTFEFFARDFLENLGYEILIHPTRGADGGKDMIVKERRKGIDNSS